MAIAVLVGLLWTGTGCAFGKAGWLAPTFVAGTVFGYFLGLEAETVIIERNCFENGEPVDCSQIPGT